LLLSGMEWELANWEETDPADEQGLPGGRKASMPTVTGVSRNVFEGEIWERKGKRTRRRKERYAGGRRSMSL